MTQVTAVAYLPGMGETHDLIARHQVHLVRRNLRPSTIYQRRRVVLRLDHQTAPRPILRLEPEEIAQALDARRIQPVTRAVELCHLRAFYDWAIDADLTATNPAAGVPRPRLPRRLPRPMPDLDKARAIERAPERIRPILILAAYAGLRAAEIAQLRTDHLVPGSPPVLIIEVSKGGAPTTVPAHPRVVELLTSLPPGWAVPRRDGLPGPVRPHLVSHLANGYLHDIGVAHTLHSLRHWFGTNLYRASAGDLRVTQEGMRHRSPVTTAGYTWVGASDVAAAVGLIPA